MCHASLHSEPPSKCTLCAGAVVGCDTGAAGQAAQGAHRLCAGCSGAPPRCQHLGHRCRVHANEMHRQRAGGYCAYMIVSTSCMKDHAAAVGWTPGHLVSGSASKCCARPPFRRGNSTISGCCCRCAGGYEHVCKVWDVRAKSATMSLDHGAPIEALAYFPSGCVPLASVTAVT